MTLGSRLLDNLAETIGEAAALKLSLRYRGNRIYVLKRYGPEDEIVQLLGQEAADKLSEFYANDSLDIPAVAGLKAALYAMADRGDLTRWEIADNLRIGRRQVYRWLAERDADSQLKLFDDD